MRFKVLVTRTTSDEPEQIHLYSQRNLQQYVL